MSKYIVSPTKNLELSSSFAEFFKKNLKTDLNFIKVYLYIQIKNEDGEDEFDLKTMAEELYLSEDEVWQAINYWEKEGELFFKEVSQKQIPMENKELKLLAQTAAKMLSKPLTHRDLFILYTLHDDLKLEIETIFLLIEYCIELKKTNMAYIEKVGISWAEKGLLKFEDAKEYLDNIKKKQGEKEYYKNFLGLSKLPSEAEYAHIKTWKEEYKFSDEEIKDAFLKTVKAIGSPSFSYANAILLSWKSDEVHMLEPKKETKKKATKNKFTDYKQTKGRYDYSEIEKKYLEKLQKKGENK